MYACIRLLESSLQMLHCNNQKSLHKKIFVDDVSSSLIRISPVKIGISGFYTRVKIIFFKILQETTIRTYNSYLSGIHVANLWYPPIPLFSLFWLSLPIIIVPRSKINSP